MAIEDVADEARPSDPLDRRAGKAGAEGGVVERRQFGERRRVQVLAGGELGLAAERGELVPGADGEAVVAAVNPVADRRPQGPGDRPFQLDRQVGDAAARVEPIGRGKGAGRTGVEAGAAGPAMVALRARRARASRSVRIAPRNSHEPNSRETRLVCLPCQPIPARAASGFSIRGAVSTNTLTFAVSGLAAAPDEPRAPSACP